MAPATKSNPDTQASDQAPCVNLIEDDADVRRSISSLLSTVGLETQAFDRSQDAVGQITNDRPGCLIIDMRLPDRDGLDLLQELRDKGVKMPAIIITAYADVPSAVRAMKLRVFDFLEKPFPEQQFIAAVQSAVEKDVARHKSHQERSGIDEKIDSLSVREKQVLRGIIAGLSSKMIAADLQISPKTVENYRANLMQKLDAENVAHLVTLVYDHFRMMN